MTSTGAPTHRHRARPAHPTAGARPPAAATPAGLSAALGSRRAGLGRPHRAPAPDPAQRRRRAGADAREPVRPHPLLPLLRPAPAHLAGRAGAVHRGRPPLPGGADLPGRRRDRRGRPVRGAARRRRTRRHHRHPGAGLRRGRVRRPGRPPGPRAGLDPARAPGRRGPGERAAPVRGRGARREPHHGAGVPPGRLPGQPGLRGGRAAPGVRHRPHRAVGGRARRPRAAGRGAQRAQPAAPPLGRGDRRLDRPDPDRARGVHQPAAGQLQRAGVPGQPGRPLGPRGARLRLGHRHPGRGGPGGGGRARGRHRPGHGLLPGEGRVRAAGAQLRASPTPGRTAPTPNAGWSPRPGRTACG